MVASKQNIAGGGFVEKDMLDVLIVGGGPAGMTAAIYSARAGFDTVVLDPMGGGGQASTTDMIHNYPGFPQGISGFGLMEAMAEQAKAFGAKILYDEVQTLGKADHVFALRSAESQYRALAVIYAAGTTPKRLGVAGESPLLGRGISFCATCDGPLHRDKTVAVVGGGDSALTEALFLTRFAREVVIIHRRDQFRAGQAAVKGVVGHPKIRLRLSAVVEGVLGRKQVESILVKDLIADNTEEMAVSGLFLYVGSTPNVSPVESLVDISPSGYVKTAEDMSTRTPGLFVAGDIRDKLFRQVATAVGDGANAAWSAERFLAERTSK